MATLITILAVAGLLAGIGAAIWVKIKRANDWADVQAVQERQTQLEAEVRKKLQEQIESERKAKQEELKNEADEILAVEDPSVRQLRALELLAKLRGVR
jgi:uncharacterized protein HemX